MYSVLKMYFDVMNRFLSQYYFNVFFSTRNPVNSSMNFNILWGVKVKAKLTA